MTKIEIKFHEIASILSVVSKAPPECSELVVYCQEGHISVPCGGDFNCEYYRKQKGCCNNDFYFERGCSF